MKKYLFVSFFILSATFANAQKAVLFKIKFSPNHTYQITTELSGTANTDLSGNKDLADKLAAQGITQPLIAKVQNVNKSTAITGALASDNSFPITMIKGAGPSINITVNGKQIPIPAPKGAEAKFFGHVSTDGKLNLDSLSGKKLNDSIAAPVKKMMNSMMGAISFPEHPMKVGESFSQTVPFNLPMGGKGMSMSINIVYKLKSISGGNAYFDISQAMDAKMDLTGLDFSLTGNGSGTMVYSIKNSYPSSSNTDIKLFITAKSEKFNLVATANMSTKTTYEIN